MSQPSRLFTVALIAMAIPFPLIAKAETPNHKEPTHHAGNPVKLGLGYAGGFLPLGHSDVGMNGAQILTGWEFEPSDKTFVTPFLIGGFAILTHESDPHASKSPPPPRIAGLFGLGTTGGLNLGPFSPYLLVEGYALPGFGLSAGFGTLYHFNDSIAVDVALHWILIPDTSKPFGLTTSGEIVASRLHELGFFVGFEL